MWAPPRSSRLLQGIQAHFQFIIVPTFLLVTRRDKNGKAAPVCLLGPTLPGWAPSARDSSLVSDPSCSLLGFQAKIMCCCVGNVTHDRLGVIGASMRSIRDDLIMTIGRKTRIRAGRARFPSAFLGTSAHAAGHFGFRAPHTSGWERSNNCVILLVSECWEDTVPIPSPTQAPIIAKQCPPNTPNTLLAVCKSCQGGVGAEDAGMSQLSETDFYRTCSPVIIMLRGNYSLAFT